MRLDGRLWARVEEGCFDEGIGCWIDVFRGVGVWNHGFAGLIISTTVPSCGFSDGVGEYASIILVQGMWFWNGHHLESREGP